MSVVLGIAVDVPLRRLFDYRAPPGTDPSRLQPGVRLWVPFGRRRVTGILVEQPPQRDIDGDAEHHATGPRASAGDSGVAGPDEFAAPESVTLTCRLDPRDRAFPGSRGPRGGCATLATASCFSRIALGGAWGYRLNLPNHAQFYLSCG